MLVLAHRTELLEQARRQARRRRRVGAIEKAERRAGFAPVVVASVQTLQGKRLAALDPDAFDVVVDEATTRRRAATARSSSTSRGSLVLGVTATPDRGDGKALGEMFASVAYRYELRDAIRDRSGSRPSSRAASSSRASTCRRSARAPATSRATSSPSHGTDEAVLGVVGPLLEQAGARRTIVFAVDVAHATRARRRPLRPRPAARASRTASSTRASARRSSPTSAPASSSSWSTARSTPRASTSRASHASRCARPTKSRGAVHADGRPRHAALARRRIACSRADSASSTACSKRPMPSSSAGASVIA
jgi:superfamily II DNA or RNA helicase